VAVSDVAFAMKKGGVDVWDGSRLVHFA